MSSEGSDVDCYVRDPDYDPKYYESTPSDVVENVDTDFDTDEPKSTSTILAEEDQGGDQDDDPDFNKEEDQKEGQEEDQDDGYEEDQDEDQEEDQKDDQDDDWEEGQDDDQEEAHEEDQDGDHEEDQDDDHEEDQDDDDQEEDPLKGKFTIRKKKNLRTYVKGQNKKTKTTKTEVSVNVTVKTCTKRKDNKRSWDKKHYCLYCHQPNNKMARHLQRKHMEVKDVAHAFSFASKSTQRKVLLEQIRRKGDFKHNVRVLAEGKGQISMQEKRWNKPDDIHLTKNVMALRDHLRMVEDKARAELEQQLSLTAYKVLNESILAQLIVFNKRREGEASRLTLEAYKKVNTNPINEDIYSTLSPLEKELSKQLTRIEVRGKRGKKSWCADEHTWLRLSAEKCRGEQSRKP
ncbi:uncharacterized protein LOC131450066 [Solea solea]|uniref:uncharacterized protein LOC131450066 n=1 Tax=Solea solea TaxID=90069 RepID=UPI00272BDE7D|nr:uncharacterized protein LOC131450066 [Solea solea]